MFNKILNILPLYIKRQLTVALLPGLHLLKNYLFTDFSFSTKTLSSKLPHV
ncbi:MAG: hypothetical protein JWR38_5098 [Mucilaginibacter sp.]|nr:hypothetical protein [Mucilaginibacter sp.]